MWGRDLVKQGNRLRRDLQGSGRALTTAFSCLIPVGLTATADIMPPASSSPMLPSPPSEIEAEFYYAGLPSNPLLVARTGTEWKAPTGPEAYRVIRELRPVGNHAIGEVWEDNLALKVHELLDAMNVKWTSTDVVRIGNAGESFAPVVLWIGVVPGSLSGDDGFVAATRCRKLLEEKDITDVEVEIRESVVTRSAGPKLLKPATSDFDPTVDIREPLTTTPSLPICPQSTSWTEGTGGFFIVEGGNNRILLVTARHVVFPSGKSKNELFEHKDSQPHHYVNLFGDAAFEGYLESIQTGIEHKAITIDYLERRIKALQKDTSATDRGRKATQAKLDDAKEAIEALNTFYQDISVEWDTPESRILGHVILSPPIDVGVGGECYTEDWAVIEIDPSKIDKSNFSGNAIDLGTCISVPEFIRMMSPDFPHACSFEYPVDRLLELKGTIPYEEMRHPTTLDSNGEPCLMVLKRGNTTGLTVGCANNVFSYVRNYYDDNVKTSKEWAILPRDSKSGDFSDLGDSGSVIVDGLGRMGGLLTSGAGSRSDLDITYATPITFLLKCMEEKGLYKPHLNPILTA